MKKAIPLLLIIILAGALLAFIKPFYSEEQKATISIPAEEEIQIWLVVTGFGSSQKNIALADLKKKYASGECFVLKDLKNKADKYFASNGGKEIADLKRFAPLAKSGWLITDADHMSGQFKALSVDGVNFFENPGKYALKTGGAFDTKLLTKYTMTGVTAITRGAGMAADKEGVGFLTEKLKPYFQNSDFVHISNEVSFKDSCEYVRGTTKFCTREIHFQALLDLNCNVVELTGNHNRDYGDKAYRMTWQWYKDHSIQIFGGGTSPEEANTPLILTMKDGKKLGLIGFNEACPLGECARKAGECGANFYEKEKAKAVIQKMRNELKVDYIIASVQFTEWDKYEPHATQLKISHDLIDMGADLVYGSQAHQIQQVEFYKGKPVFFGLGNFLFDQIHRPAVRQAFFLNHYFYKGKLIQTIPVFTFMKENRQQSIASEAEEAEMRKAVYLDSLLYK